MTAKRILAAILLTLGLAAAGSAVTATGGAAHPATAAASTHYWG